MAATMGEATLYKRLGGYDVICAFVDQWLGLVLGDDQLAGYFKGMSNDTKGKARQLIVDYVVSSLGGPAIYAGRTMKVLHEGLGISEGEYTKLMQHAQATLDAMGVPSQEREEVLAWLESQRADTVERM